VNAFLKYGLTDDVTDTLKLEGLQQMIRRHEYYREAIKEVLYELPLKDPVAYELFVSGIVFGRDKAACDMARELILTSVEKVMQQRGEDWSDFT
jgi:hypothetical protein